jgi:hypothetical protein
MNEQELDKFCAEYECAKQIIVAPDGSKPEWFAAIGHVNLVSYDVYSNSFHVYHFTDSEIIKTYYNLNRNYCLFALKHTNWHKLPPDIITNITQHLKPS